MFGLYKGKKGKEWFYGHLLENYKLSTRLYGLVDVEPDSLSIFTGYLDKYENPIYEGDVLYNEDKEPYFVEIHKNETVLVCENESLDIDEQILDYWEVIGHRFEWQE